YLVYSHHHADHAGASSLFDKNVTRIGHEETRRLLLRDDDPARPPNEETFQDHRTLEIGGERIDLAWHGANHSPDNIIIHLPDHDTLMLIDIVNPGWARVYVANLTEDIPGYIEAPANALAGTTGLSVAGCVHRVHWVQVGAWSRDACRQIRLRARLQASGLHAPTCTQCTRYTQPATDRPVERTRTSTCTTRARPSSTARIPAASSTPTDTRAAGGLPAPPAGARTSSRPATRCSATAATPGAPPPERAQFPAWGRGGRLTRSSAAATSS